MNQFFVNIENFWNQFKFVKRSPAPETTQILPKCQDDLNSLHKQTKVD